MKAVVVYESMYGNTHLVADAIGAGLRERAAANDAIVVVPVGAATPQVLAGADLVVVGGPTHAHGMSRVTTRKAAVAAAEKPESPLEVDPDAEGPGLREWFDSLDGLGALPTQAAAFDTRMDAPPLLTGRASQGIARRLRNAGCHLVAVPESFLVTKGDHLADHEEQHARGWGADLVIAPELRKLSSSRE
jgi:hypothetical protein